MKQKLKYGFAVFFCGAMTLAGLSAAIETGKAINLLLAIVFLLLTILLVLKWPRKKLKATDKVQPDVIRPVQPQPVELQVPIAEIYTRSIDTEEDITAKEAPFSYLDARALIFWNKKTTDYQVPSYYADSAFGRNAESAKKRLMGSKPKYLKIGEVKKSIELKTAPELKELLSSRGLKVSGKKAELVQRLVDNVSKEELEAMFPVRVYEITDAGQEALKYYSIIFANENHNLGISFYRLLKEKAVYPSLADEEILLQVLLQDLDKADKNGKQESYRVIAERTAQFLEEIGKPQKAFGVYCASFFMFWYRNTVELKVNVSTEAYSYPAKAIDRCGKLCGYSWKETLTHFRECVQEINPFGLGTSRNIDMAIKAFKDALSMPSL